MNLIIHLLLREPEFSGTGGPAEAARRLRELASEIETNVPDFSACREGQRIAGSQDDCSCIAYLVEL
ncbi:cell division protein ZapA [Cupriavidus taiwanensis]|uniref:Uncharacterized protein n=1 Tax=Cupriavidus taiwanensis TaxID=164546 RepID=A0A7Z7JGQ9_9BURK|nr:cell division protein ZapA [Cupriavidus taiwanensis]SOZ16395.1 conserved hypothetical protein [Cupriavidus taiwanensis]SOZ95301.1 conserved hypothetical protein [Cupriavidus taiwanensis]SPC25218.1 conserved hypothetical protein [Cupriavidus taiwanensis]SPD37134.1 conserved protein of unknown function [Cupriavidus taiwanensis]SPD37793.1 conserved protein of unknown function [Cupriavidus taiwanensis]